MNVATHPVWAVLTCMICVSPFWFLASSLDDGTEVIATAMGGALAGILTMVLKHFSKVTCAVCKKKIEEAD